MFKIIRGLIAYFQTALGGRVIPVIGPWPGTNLGHSPPPPLAALPSAWLLRPGPFRVIFRDRGEPNDSETP